MRDDLLRRWKSCSDFLSPSEMAQLINQLIARFPATPAVECERCGVDSSSTMDGLCLLCFQTRRAERAEQKLARIVELAEQVKK